MQIIDFIHNIAAWILWVNGWMQLHNPTEIQRPLTLLGTLVGPSRRIGSAWIYFGGFLLILLVKVLLLHYLGAPIDPTLSMNFMLLVVYFKTASLSSMFWMAVASFLKFAMIAYIWLWFLSRLSPRNGAENIVNGLGASLGFLQSRHWLIQVLLLLTFGFIGWVFLAIVFGWQGILPVVSDVPHLLWQALCISICAWLGLYYLIILLMLLYLIHSYVHLGNWEGWDWVDEVAGKLLSPLSRLPFQWASIDFAPLVILLLNWCIYLSCDYLILLVYQG